MSAQAQAANTPKPQTQRAGLTLTVGQTAVLIYPGSNCDHDALYAIGQVLKRPVVPVWHKDGQLPEGTDLVIVPGGFSFGDYLRCGAIAKFSPASRALVRHAANGGRVLGICNGFQILTELGLLPGALMRNRGLRFVCRDVRLRVESTDSGFTRYYKQGQVLTLPTAHGEGCYFADPETLDRLEGEDRVAFRYCDAKGEITPASSPNGSLRNIAGILGTDRNVLGLMPHPERRVEELLGGADGLALLRAATESMV